MLEAYKAHNFDICISSHSEPQTREVLTLLETELEKVRRATTVSGLPLANWHVQNFRFAKTHYVRPTSFGF